ncbi:MAG TPA: sigma-70 family RNA polymerase sigma factor [Caldithrix sp.]|nr:sigma-70 family RNA polymerase sigma factor [Caldithrix sp.]
MNQKVLTDDIAIWVESYTQDLYSWALHKVSDSTMAADLVQDTFLAAVEKIDSFKGNSSPKTWLFSILNHKIIDHYRKKVKQPIHLENQALSSFFSDEGDWKEIKKPKNWHEKEDEQHLLDDNEFLDVLKKCLDALPDKWSFCVKLKYLSDKSGDEICQELDITPSNYWQIIHRAKLQLLECIENNWFD